MRMPMVAWSVCALGLASACVYRLDQLPIELSEGDVTGVLVGVPPGMVGVRPLALGRALLRGSSIRRQANNEGRFVIRNLPEGGHTLLLEYDVGDGAIPELVKRLSVPIRIAGSGRSSVDLGNVELLPPGTITGSVIVSAASGGDPSLTGVRVALTDGDSFVQVDPATGRFELPGLAEGEWTVVAMRADLLSRPLTVNVRSGQVTDAGQLVLELAPTDDGTLQGEVLDPLPATPTSRLGVTTAPLENLCIRVVDLLRGASQDHPGRPSSFGISGMRSGLYAVGIYEGDCHSGLEDILLPQVTVLPGDVTDLGRLVLNVPPVGKDGCEDLDGDGLCPVTDAPACTLACTTGATCNGLDCDNDADGQSDPDEQDATTPCRCSITGSPADAVACAGDPLRHDIDGDLLCDQFEPVGSNGNGSSGSSSSSSGGSSSRSGEEVPSSSFSSESSSYSSSSSSSSGGLMGGSSSRMGVAPYQLPVWTEPLTVVEGAGITFSPLLSSPTSNGGTLVAFSVEPFAAGALRFPQQLTAGGCPDVVAAEIPATSVVLASLVPSGACAWRAVLSPTGAGTLAELQGMAFLPRAGTSHVVVAGSIDGPLAANGTQVLSGPAGRPELFLGLLDAETGQWLSGQSLPNVAGLVPGQLKVVPTEPVRVVFLGVLGESGAAVTVGSHTLTPLGSMQGLLVAAMDDTLTTSPYAALLSGSGQVDAAAALDAHPSGVIRVAGTFVDAVEVVDPTGINLPPLDSPSVTSAFLLSAHVDALATQNLETLELGGTPVAGASPGTGSVIVLSVGADPSGTTVAACVKRLQPRAGSLQRKMTGMDAVVLAHFTSGSTADRLALIHGDESDVFRPGSDAFTCAGAAASGTGQAALVGRFTKAMLFRDGQETATTIEDRATPDELHWSTVLVSSSNALLAGGSVMMRGSGVSVTPDVLLAPPSLLSDGSAVMFGRMQNTRVQVNRRFDCGGLTTSGSTQVDGRDINVGALWRVQLGAQQCGGTTSLLDPSDAPDDVTGTLPTLTPGSPTDVVLTSGDQDCFALTPSPGFRVTAEGTHPDSRDDLVLSAFVNNNGMWMPFGTADDHPYLEDLNAPLQLAWPPGNPPIAVCVRGHAGRPAGSVSVVLTADGASLPANDTCQAASNIMVDSNAVLLVMDGSTLGATDNATSPAGAGCQPNVTGTSDVFFRVEGDTSLGIPRPLEARILSTTPSLQLEGSGDSMVCNATAPLACAPPNGALRFSLAAGQSFVMAANAVSLMAPRGPFQVLLTHLPFNAGDDVCSEGSPLINATRGRLYGLLDGNTSNTYSGASLFEEDGITPGLASPGQDRVYRLELPSGRSMRIRLDLDNGQESLLVLDGCPSSGPAAVLAQAENLDDVGQPNGVQVQVTNHQVGARHVWVVVDRRDATPVTAEEYRLQWEVLP